MYARVIELSGVSPEEIDKDLRFFEEEILPQAEAIPGMSGGLVLVDRAEGRAQVITLYADEETLVQGREQARMLQGLAFQRMNFRSQPVVREYEVGVARLAAPVLPVHG